jgi:hypothetical protein
MCHRTQEGTLVTIVVLLKRSLLNEEMLIAMSAMVSNGKIKSSDNHHANTSM